MFQTGDKVVYGIHGVCVVTGMEEKQLDGRRVTYLVLEPAIQDGSRYMVPTHNAAAMGKLSPMLSRQEMDRLLKSSEVRAQSWIPDENQRKQRYRELIGSADRVRLMAMVHAIYCHKQSQTAAGRKCHMCDENFLRDAERLLSSEISAVMDWDAQQARQYIRDMLAAETSA